MDTEATPSSVATPRRPRRVLKFFAFLLSFVLGVFASFGLIFLFSRWPSDFSKYTGDGVPRETLTTLQRIRYLPFTLLPRYELAFASFDMRRPFYKEFRISGLPKNVRGDALVMFKIVSAKRYNDFYRMGQELNPTGILRYRLQKNGTDMFDQSGEVEFYRGDSFDPTRGGLFEHVVYLDDEGSTYFNPHSLTPDDVLTLLVEYEPGDDPVEGICMPMIRAGGAF